MGSGGSGGSCETQTWFATYTVRVWPVEHDAQERCSHSCAFSFLYDTIECCALYAHGQLDWLHALAAAAKTRPWNQKVEQKVDSTLRAKGAAAIARTVPWKGNKAPSTAVAKATRTKMQQSSATRPW